MTDIYVSSKLWASSMMPEGILERWRVADGATLAEGDVVAEVRIEDALHELIAPGKGRLTQLAGVNDVIEPGSLIGRIG
jgi:pyruvate/2-oxoglutarate dehydrogenase complex dihydrolipoamide acyltransferase (E2) component